MILTVKCITRCFFRSLTSLLVLVYTPQTKQPPRKTIFLYKPVIWELIYIYMYIHICCFMHLCELATAESNTLFQGTVFGFPSQVSFPQACLKRKEEQQADHRQRTQNIHRRLRISSDLVCASEGRPISIHWIENPVDYCKCSRLTRVACLGPDNHNLFLPERLLRI